MEDMKKSKMKLSAWVEQCATEDCGLSLKAKDIDTVFHQLRITSTSVEVVLGEWMQEAGIQKHITSHMRSHNKIFY